MRQSAVILIACGLVVGALLIAFFGGSNRRSATDPIGSVPSPATAVTNETPPTSDTADESPEPESGLSPTNATLDVPTSTEADSSRELTNPEALELRDERFGWARDSRDPYAYAPTIKVTPAFPPEAIPLELSGFVLMEYTVGADGTIGPIAVLNASSPLFEFTAIRSVERYKYAPRIEQGQFVGTNGVKTLIVYGEPNDVPSVQDATEQIFVSVPDTE